MAYESFVGLRYLMAKKRSSVVSIITMISVTGVALGVTALIVVLSVMGGFKKDLKEKILGTKAHIVVQAPGDKPLKKAREVAERIVSRQELGVTGASPFLESEVMISSPAGLSGVMLRGIVPERIGQVSELREDIIKGDLDYLHDDRELMDNLAAERDRELDELIAKIKKERAELERIERERAGAGVPEASDGEDTQRLRDPGEVVDGAKLPGVDELPLLAPAEADGPPTSPRGAPEREPDPKEGAPSPRFAPMGEGEGGEGGGPLEAAASLEEAAGIPDLPGDEDAMMPSLSGDGGDAGAMPTLPGQGEGDGGQGEGDGGDGERERLPGLVVGPELAKSLQVGLGDEVNVVTPRGELGPMGRMPRSRPFRVVGVFYSGMYEYDANFAYTTLEDAMDFVGQEGATGVELKTADVDVAVEVAGRVQEFLGAEYEVLDWMELNRSLFYALKLEKIAMFVVLTFIILVASFSIVAMLIMIVIEKGREIAVLKSLGATDAGVMRTFIFQGTVIGAVGAVIGLVLGLVICYLLQEVGFPLDEEVYYISTLPVDLNWAEVVTVVVCAIGISVLATIYPSIQAARLKPVDGLRDD